jgi:hypothetical protein
MRLVLLAALFLLTGCATIVQRGYQRIPVSSDPPGASIDVQCGRSAKVTTLTPATISVSRRAVPCVIAVSKDGYQTATTTLTRAVSRAFWANFLWSPVLAVAGYAGGEDDCNHGGFLCTTRSEDAVGFFVLGIIPAGIGAGVDATTGAMYARSPKAIDVRLAPR